MKEETLRKMIRQQIKSSLNEAPVKAAVGKTFGRVEKMAGVKMLKKALGQGSPNQQAAGLYQVVQSISGNNPTVGKMLARMIMKGGIAAAEPEAPVSEDAYTAGIDDGAAGTSIEENKALANRQAKVDNTQAMKMLKTALASKSATVQTDFVLDMINNLNLKDAAKQRLKMKIKQELK